MFFSGEKNYWIKLCYESIVVNSSASEFPPSNSRWCVGTGKSIRILCIHLESKIVHSNCFFSVLFVSYPNVKTIRKLQTRCSCSVASSNNFPPDKFIAKANLSTSVHPHLYQTSQKVQSPVLGHKAMEKNCHLHLRKVGSYAESHPSAESHELFSRAIDLNSLYTVFQNLHVI